MRINRAPRVRRHFRVRKKVSGSGARPRLDVFRSSKHIYAQVINDEEGRTLAAASTLDKDFSVDGKSAATVDAAKAVGRLVARRAIEKGVKQVVFDRGGYLYHGRVAALAAGAREEGLEF